MKPIIEVLSKHKTNNEKWYLLFSGSSSDGMGSPSYVGRTLNQCDAMNHYIEEKSSPYNNGHVEIVTDKSISIATLSDLEQSI